MPQQSRQSLLRLLKRWHRYMPRESWRAVPPMTRGFYVLYKKAPRAKCYDVQYIGFDAAGKKGSGVRARLKAQVARRRQWTHYSLVEVHDNVTRDEIRQLEALLRQIFRDDVAAPRK